VHLANEVLGALLLIYIEVLVVVAVSLVFSSFSTPFLSGALAFGVFLVGRFADKLRTMVLAEKPEDLGGPLETMQTLVRGVAEIVPDLSRFNATSWVVYDARIPDGYLFSASAYGLTYAALCMVVAVVLFMRRDFV
jgi:Cu-processing system permease protein